MKTAELKLEILNYLAEHPDAQDTLEGVVEWWLSPHKVKKPEVGSVDRALIDLVNEGLVVACRGTRTCYKLNRRKLKEISALLKKSRKD